MVCHSKPTQCQHLRWEVACSDVANPRSRHLSSVTTSYCVYPAVQGAVVWQGAQGHGASVLKALSWFKLRRRFWNRGLSIRRKVVCQAAPRIATWLKSPPDLKWKASHADHLSVHRNWILVSNGGSSRLLFIAPTALGNCNKNGRLHSKWCRLSSLLYAIPLQNSGKSAAFKVSEGKK